MLLDLRRMYSLTDFLRHHKDHVARLRSDKTPEVLTVNGKPQLVVQDAEGYQLMLDRLEYAENLAGVRLAYEQVRGGKAVDFEKAAAELRTEYGV